MLTGSDREQISGTLDQRSIKIPTTRRGKVIDGTNLTTGTMSPSSQELVNGVMDTTALCARKYDFQAH